MGGCACSCMNVHVNVRDYAVRNLVRASVREVMCACARVKEGVPACCSSAFSVSLPFSHLPPILHSFLPSLPFPLLFFRYNKNVDRRREYFSCAADGTMCLWDGRTLKPRSHHFESFRRHPVLPLCSCTILSTRPERSTDTGEPHAIVVIGCGSGNVYLYDCDHIDR